MPAVCEWRLSGAEAASWYAPPSGGLTPPSLRTRAMYTGPCPHRVRSDTESLGGGEPAYLARVTLPALSKTSLGPWELRGEEVHGLWTGLGKEATPVERR